MIRAAIDMTGKNKEYVSTAIKPRADLSAWLDKNEKGGDKL